jgi:hypothetical protein
MEKINNMKNKLTKQLIDKVLGLPDEDFEKLLRIAVIQSETERIRKEVKYYMNLSVSQLSDYSED